MILTEIPPDVKKLVVDKKVDFCVKARKEYSKRDSYGMLIFGIIWIIFVGFISKSIFSEQINFQNSNYFFSVESFQKWKPELTPLLIIGLFLIIGIIILFCAVFMIFCEGGYFIGTEVGLIKYRNNKVAITDWKQFSGTIQLENKNNFGYIEFKLKTGKIVKSKNNPDRFVPETISIIGVNDVFRIEKLCLIRIKENNLLQ